jgi:hypothetical protein
MVVVVKRLRETPPRALLVAVVVFVVLGVVMNGLGHAWSIAWFRHWWQVVPCYVGYVWPLAVLVRGRPLASAWATSILAFIPLELAGYALGTSVIADDNVIATLLGPHNFTLAMVLLVSPTPLVGNAIVDVVLRLVPGPPPPSAP